MSFEEPSVTDRAVWIGVGVTAGIAAIAAIVFGLYFLGSSDSPDDAACAQGCLDTEAAESLYPSKAVLRPIGMLASVGYEGNPDWDANAYAVRSGVNWQRSDGTPAACEFTSQWGVLGAAPLTDDEEDDPTIDFGGWYSDFDEIGQLVRVLDGETEAEDLITSLDRAIDSCPSFSIKTNVTDTYEPTVTETDLEVVASASVAAWVEETTFGTNTIVFIQERNLVTRIIASRYTGTELTDEQLAAFVHATSQRMSELEP